MGSDAGSGAVYLNGAFVSYEQARVSVEDRGMLFGDGIYEVVRSYGGVFFALEDHLRRMAASAAAVRLRLPPAAELTRALEGCLSRSGLSDASVYLQVTRGHPGPRQHALPVDCRPTVFAIARPPAVPDALHVTGGAAAVTVPDQRWLLCNVKSIGLLLNSLAKQAALDAGAQEAMFIRDGVLTEGSATNAFVVRDGCIYTHPEGPFILPGITRAVVLRLCAQQDLAVRFEPVPAAELPRCDEVFVTGTNSEVLPIVRINGSEVGDGRPGPLTRRLQEAFAVAVRAAALSR